MIKEIVPGDCNRASNGNGGGSFSLTPGVFVDPYE